MFAVKVGDEVGTVWSSSYSYTSATIRKVIKVNGHGHIYLDNGEVYDKHGKIRVADKKAYSGMRLVEAKYVYAEKTANVERQRKNAIAAAITKKFAGLKNGFGDVCTVSDEDKAELIALINSL